MPIIFRKLDRPVPPGLAPVHLVAEYWPKDKETAYPWGQCWVSDWTANEIFPVLMVDMILVNDAHRRRGIGRRLLRAVERRWPGKVDLGEAVSKAGERLLQAHERDAESG